VTSPQESGPARPSRTFVDCLIMAWERFERSRPASQDDAGTMLLELASWMQWAGAVDKQLMELAKEQMVPPNERYAKRRGDDPNGRGLLGLAYVWGLLRHEGHRLDDALVLVEVGLDAPIVLRASHPPRSQVFRAPVWEARWKPFRELRQRTIWEPPRNYQPAYQEHLEGRPVITSCAPIQAFLLVECHRVPRQGPGCAIGCESSPATSRVKLTASAAPP
jgi:hypothetical protein